MSTTDTESNVHPAFEVPEGVARMGRTLTVEQLALTYREARRDFDAACLAKDPRAGHIAQAMRWTEALLNEKGYEVHLCECFGAEPDHEPCGGTGDLLVPQHCGTCGFLPTEHPVRASEVLGHDVEGTDLDLRCDHWEA